VEVIEHAMDSQRNDDKPEILLKPDNGHENAANPMVSRVRARIDWAMMANRS